MDFKTKFKEAMTIKFDNAFGLDISDRSVEIIELEKVFRFSVATYGRAELPEGIVEDGKIVDQNTLAIKLKNLLREAKPKRVSTNKVVLSLPESQIFVRCFTVEAKLKTEDLNQAILDQVSTSLPIRADKMYWDFLQKPLPDKTKQLIIFIGVPKDIAIGYVKFCNSIGLEVISLNAESLSLARAILKKSDRQSLIMDIGSRSTNLVFFDSNDKMSMSVTVPLAGDNFTKAISDSLNLEVPEAEMLKQKYGFKNDSDNTVLSAIMPIFEDILNETNGAIHYYEETFKQKLDDVYLVGGSSLLPGISEVAKSKLGKPVSIVSSGNNINLRFLAHKEKDFSLFANVIGLGMLGASGQFKDTNLLKKIPASEVNTINKLDLFKLGYLSRLTVIRTLLDNKIFLAVVIILIVVIFAVLLQQVQNYGAASVSSSITGL